MLLTCHLYLKECHCALNKALITEHFLEKQPPNLLWLHVFVPQRRRSIKTVKNHFSKKQTCRKLATISFLHFVGSSFFFYILISTFAFLFNILSNHYLTQYRIVKWFIGTRPSLIQSFLCDGVPTIERLTCPELHALHWSNFCLLKMTEKSA